ncbi:DegT/DnrJ/EryC1/StrS aminotransferase family protein [Salegentibacter sp. Hel_I_6]|uniref:DegT/DnrJ/EryC1/StrS family aminotransferase n=1 Tax=Salegentibacter sp. Hel_I_6 TaxID=1250278 RepID=UPI0009DEE2E6|nr:DegT/DnrJ/EryC1/StrS family aminotransferase [Salegentibacter sp. Hel_I_6]
MSKNLPNFESIYVTKTYLPERVEYSRYLDRIWESGIVTNNGQLVVEFEEKIQNFLQSQAMHFVANGTIALQLAIKALKLKGEIITTPYSYVATTTSILWENCSPVFVDINEDDFCINPDLIEEKITGKTTAILATHVYGIPCNVLKIEKIAKKHDLKVIYDGAHAFNVKINNTSIFNYGDIATLSFHATKIFHTIEGGALFTSDKILFQKISLQKAFGHRGDNYETIGINAKNSEFHAAIGLCNLKMIEGIIDKREHLFNFYKENLKELPLQFLKIPDEVSYNYGYFPIVFKSKKIMLKTIETLNDDNIFPRRYFYPSLNQLNYLKNSQSCPVSESVSEKVLCLPFYHDLKKEDAIRIINLIKRVFR